MLHLMWSHGLLETTHVEHIALWAVVVLHFLLVLFLQQRYLPFYHYFVIRINAPIIQLCPRVLQGKVARWWVKWPLPICFQNQPADCHMCHPPKNQARCHHTEIQRGWYYKKVRSKILTTSLVLQNQMPSQGSTNSFCKGPDLKSFGVCGPYGLSYNTQFCCCKMTGAIGNLKTNACTWVPIKLYSLKQRVGQISPAGCSFTTPAF